MTKKQGWIIYGLGFVLLTALDYILFGMLFPQLMFAMAGVLEIIWLIGWLLYMSYKFDF
ncbi:MAG: hypothetical protein RBR50_10110 [Candidatus Izemoplasmatales bacterium]|nr:hypothetical protein [Candidatus Izemoplasmatales bacterium]